MLLGPPEKGMGMKSTYLQRYPDTRLSEEEAEAEVRHWTTVELAEHAQKVRRNQNRGCCVKNLDAAVHDEQSRRELLKAQIDAGEPRST
jgi:hypothetical protein